MTLILLNYFHFHGCHLPRYHVDLNLKKRALLLAIHEIVLYVSLQHVDFLLYRESHLLPRIEFNCETGLFRLRSFFSEPEVSKIVVSVLRVLTVWNPLLDGSFVCVFADQQFSFAALKVDVKDYELDMGTQ